MPPLRHVVASLALALAATASLNGPSPAATIGTFDWMPLDQAEERLAIAPDDIEMILDAGLSFQCGLGRRTLKYANGGLIEGDADHWYTTAHVVLTEDQSAVSGYLGYCSLSTYREMMAAANARRPPATHPIVGMLGVDLKALPLPSAWSLDAARVSFGNDPPPVLRAARRPPPGFVPRQGDVVYQVSRSLPRWRQFGLKPVIERCVIHYALQVAGGPFEIGTDCDAWPGNSGGMLFEKDDKGRLFLIGFLSAACVGLCADDDTVGTVAEWTMANSSIAVSATPEFFDLPLAIDGVPACRGGDFVVSGIRPGDSPGLVIRQRANWSGARVGVIPPAGVGINVIGRCTGAWCKVQYQCLSGFAASRYLKPARQTYALAAVGFSLREGPGTNYRQVGAVPEGLAVLVVHTCKVADPGPAVWCLVTSGAQSGWTDSSNLKKR